MITKQTLDRWLSQLDDVLLGDTAVIVTLRTDVLRQRRVLDEEVKVPALPPLEPIRKAAANRTGSIIVACPTCGAKPGQRCFRMARRGPGAPPTKEIAPSFHHTRSRAAREAKAVSDVRHSLQGGVLLREARASTALDGETWSLSTPTDPTKAKKVS